MSVGNTMNMKIISSTFVDISLVKYLRV